MAKAKPPASSNGAAELVPRAQSSCQLIMPLFYYTWLAEGAEAQLDLQDPESESEEIPCRTKQGYIIPWLLTATSPFP